MYKFEVWYESYPISIDSTGGGKMILFSPEGRTLCSRIIGVECLDNYHSEIFKALEEDGFSNFMMHSRKLNEDGSTDKEFEELRYREFYSKFPIFKDAFLKLDKIV